MAAGGELAVWVVYESPEDFPGKWILRRQFARPDGTVRAEGVCFVADSLAEVRRFIPPGLVNLGRRPGDVAAIREVWI